MTLTGINGNANVDTNGNGVTFAAALSGTGGLTVFGGNALTLAASNNFTGSTTVLNSQLILADPNAAENTTINLSASGGLGFSTNGGTITTFFIGALAGSGYTVLNDSAYPATISVGGNGASTTFSGVLTGSGGLTKTGSGTLNLCGFNSYTGVTSIVNGELILDFSQTSAAEQHHQRLEQFLFPGLERRQLGFARQPRHEQQPAVQRRVGQSGLVGHRLERGRIELPAPQHGKHHPPGSDGRLHASRRRSDGYQRHHHHDPEQRDGDPRRLCDGQRRDRLGKLRRHERHCGQHHGIYRVHLRRPRRTKFQRRLNVMPTGVQTAVTSADTFNTLNLSGTVGVSMSGAGSLTLLGGGLIGNSSGGTISGGSLQGPPSGELVVIMPQNLTIAAVIADNGGPTALTKGGPAALVLTGSNTYTGVTTIGAGTLQVGNGGAGEYLASPSVIVCNNAVLAFNASDSLTYGGVISGSGGLTQLGPGTVTLPGSNTFTGTTIVAGGTLEIGNGGSGEFLASAAVVLGSSATVAFNHADLLTYSGVISGGGNLVKTGGGTLVLTAGNTYTGNTVVAGGTLQVGNGGAGEFVASPSVSVANSAALVFSQADSLTCRCHQWQRQRGPGEFGYPDAHGKQHLHGRHDNRRRRVDRMRHFAGCTAALTAHWARDR